MATNAPFPGVWRPGSKGVPVAVVQRTLRALGYTKVVAKGKWGFFTTRAVKDFQKRMGLPVSGVYGLHTHQRLKGHMAEPDRRLLRAYVARVARARAAAARAVKVVRIQVDSAVMLNRAAAIHYTQGPHRMDGVRYRQDPTTIRYGDCSAMATYLDWRAGLPDPNGRGYDGEGYTGTLCQHGRAVPLAQAAPGDKVFYGDGAPWGHVATVIGGAGSGASAFSHGSESGPKHVEVDYRPVGEVRRYF